MQTLTINLVMNSDRLIIHATTDFDAAVALAKARDGYVVTTDCDTPDNVPVHNRRLRMADQKENQK